MTDFGRKTGTGDMLKSVYDTNNDGVVDAVPGHKTSHQDEQSDEINVTGLTGTTPKSILGDATPGRNLRLAYLLIENGTTADTVKCTLTSLWNGDAIAVTDNIPKGGSAGHFSLNAAGSVLTLAAAGLTGTPLAVLGVMTKNLSTVHLILNANVLSNNIRFVFINNADGGSKNQAALVDTGSLAAAFLYITDA